MPQVKHERAATSNVKAENKDSKVSSGRWGSVKNKGKRTIPPANPSEWYRRLHPQGKHPHSTYCKVDYHPGTLFRLHSPNHPRSQFDEGFRDIWIQKDARDVT